MFCRSPYGVFPVDCKTAVDTFAVQHTDAWSLGLNRDDAPQKCHITQDPPRRLSARSYGGIPCMKYVSSFPSRYGPYRR